MFEFGEQNASHIFDGMAMIRRYNVEQDQTSPNKSIPAADVTFSRRMIESEFFKANMAEGKMTKSGIGSTPVHWGLMVRQTFSAAFLHKMAIFTTISTFMSILPYNTVSIVPLASHFQFLL